MKMLLVTSRRGALLPGGYPVNEDDFCCFTMSPTEVVLWKIQPTSHRRRGPFASPELHLRSHMAQVLNTLQSREHDIHRMCEVAGVAGASVGVIHLGETVYTKHFGPCEVDRGLEPNDDTVYRLGSV